MSKSAEGVGYAEGSHAPADDPHHTLQHGIPLLNPTPGQSGGIADSSPFSPLHSTPPPRRMTSVCSPKTLAGARPASTRWYRRSRFITAPSTPLVWGWEECMDKHRRQMCRHGGFRRLYLKNDATGSLLYKICRRG